MSQPKEYKIVQAENGYMAINWQAGNANFNKINVFEHIEEVFEFLMKEMGPKSDSYEIKIIEGKPF